MENTKKTRGCNYTPSERTMLLEIIHGKKNIIENKSTNGDIIRQKQSAWIKIAEEYNAIQTSGRRSWQQLRHTYDNLKQKLRKNVANENKQQYIRKMDENLKNLKAKASFDKKQKNLTGGGSYTSVLTETDHQVLAMIGPQTQPLPNPYDDAAVYFGDNVEIEIDINKETQIIEIQNDKENTEKNREPQTEEKPYINKKVPKEKEGIKEMTKTITNYKDEYFKIKYETARMEKKLMEKKYRNEFRKQKLDLELTKLKIMRLNNIINRKK